MYFFGLYIFLLFVSLLRQTFINKNRRRRDTNSHNIMTKNEAKANIESLATKEGRKIAISELPKTFVVEGQEVVCSDGRFRSDDRHFWPNGVKPAAEDRPVNGTTAKSTTGKRTTYTKRTTRAAAVKMLQQRVIISRLVTAYYVSDTTRAAAVELANKRKQERRLECAMNQYNEQLKEKAAAKQAAAAKKQAAATVASDDDLILKVMAERAAAGDAAAAAYLESINKLSEARKAESEKIAATETAAKVTKKGKGKKTA